MDLNSFLFSFWIKLICSCHQLVTFIDDNVFLFSLNLFFHKLTIYSKWQYLGLVNIKFLLDVKASFTINCEHFIGWHRFQHLMGSRFYAIFYQGRTSFMTFCFFCCCFFFCTECTSEKVSTLKGKNLHTVIWVVAGPICLIVGFLVHWLKFIYSKRLYVSMHKLVNYREKVHLHTQRANLCTTQTPALQNCSPNWKNESCYRKRSFYCLRGTVGKYPDSLRSLKK